jgi:hypothetical protein
MNKVLRVIPGLALALALTVGALIAPANSEAADRCPFEDILCPAVYDPVICVNGKIYSNGCYALADCAVGCVPYDPPA